MGFQALVRQQHRERELAGDRRAGRFARGLARREQQAYLRRNWRLFLGLGVAALCPSLLILPFLPNAFGRGLIVGASTTAIGGFLAFWVVQATGTAPTMMGDQGEQWTAQELRKLRRRGWRVVNHIMLRQWDIDHVLVGPGGLFAIETKWSAKAWVTDPPEERIYEAASRAAGSARDLSLWLKQLSVGPVEPVVVLWGSNARELEPLKLCSVAVVSGPHAKSWRESLRDDCLSRAQVDAAWSRLDAQCRIRDPLEDGTAPLPPSLGDIAVRCFLVIMAACAGFLAACSWLASGISPWWWVYRVRSARRSRSRPASLRTSRPARGFGMACWGWAERSCHYLGTDPMGT
jgi:Nuclease-related domain